MGKHVNISPEGSRSSPGHPWLVEAYAHCADRRDQRVKCRCLPQTPISGVDERHKIQRLHRNWTARALAPVFADLNQYAATMHFLGNTRSLSATHPTEAQRRPIACPITSRSTAGPALTIAAFATRILS